MPVPVRIAIRRAAIAAGILAMAVGLISSASAADAEKAPETPKAPLSTNVPSESGGCVRTNQQPEGVVSSGWGFCSLMRT